MKKTYVIIGLLILFYSLALITQRHFYPIMAFNMFAELRLETEGVMYIPYAINDKKDLLIFDKFNPWPIRRADIHNTLDYWVRNDLTKIHLAALGPFLLSLSQRQNPDRNFKCYGIMQIRWPLDASLDRR